MRILYILRTEYGTMGSAASNMIPMVVSEKYHVKVLSNHNPKSKEPISFYSDSLDITRVQANSFHGQIRSIFEAIKLFNPNIIHLFSGPNLLSLVRHLKHRFPHINLLVDIRSPLLQDNKEKVLAKKKEFHIIQFYADHIVTCDKASLKTYIEMPMVDFTVVPVGVDLNMFPKLESIASNQRISKFVFAGSLFKKRKVGRLVDFFNLLSSQSEYSIKLDIIGDGDDRRNLLDLIEKYEAKNIRCLGILPQNELFQKLDEYDAGIAYVPYELYSMAPSLKSIEYAAAGIPVLASDTTGHSNYNSEHGFCFELFPNTKEGFVNVFKNVIENGLPVEHIIKNNKAVESFDWNYLAKKKLIPVYEKLYRLRHKRSEISNFKDT